MTRILKSNESDTFIPRLDSFVGKRDRDVVRRVFHPLMSGLDKAMKKLGGKPTVKGSVQGWDFSRKPENLDRAKSVRQQHDDLWNKALKDHPEKQEDMDSRSVNEFFKHGSAKIAGIVHSLKDVADLVGRSVSHVWWHDDGNEKRDVEVVFEGGDSGRRGVVLWCDGDLDDAAEIVITRKRTVRKSDGQPNMIEDDPEDVTAGETDEVFCVWPARPECVLAFLFDYGNQIASGLTRDDVGSNTFDLDPVYRLEQIVELVEEWSAELNS